MTNRARRDRLEAAAKHPVGLDHLIQLEEKAHPGIGAEVELGVERRRFLRRLALVRRRAGLSQAEVATRMGTSQSLVARLESGVSDPKLSTLQRYSGAVGIQITPGEGDPISDPPDSGSRGTGVTETSRLVLSHLRTSIDRLLSDAGESNAGDDDGAAARSPAPIPIRVVGTETGYEVQAPLPGLSADDVELTFGDGVLTIDQRAAGHGAAGEEGAGCGGSSRRRVTLPGEIEADRIQARMTNGLLTVRLPKATRTRERRISITGFGSA